MSNRNTQASKAAARERIRAERERQKKKDKLRRQLVVTGALVGVLAVAGGIGFMVMKANEPTGWEAAKEAEPVAPAHTQGKNGTEILIGDKNAKETLEVFEDVRCPSCASFEQTAGPALLKDIKDGRYRVRFSMYTFIDDSPAGGEGSKNALSALGAALNVSPDAFLKYKTALYSAKFHPEEQVDSYGKDAELLKVAATVPELKNNKAFETAVKKGTYDRWVMDMTALFGRKGVKGTPTFIHGDKKLTIPEVPLEQRQQMTPAQYAQAVQANFKKMINTEFGPAKGSGKPDPGKGGSKDEEGQNGIREGEKDPTASR